MTGAWNSEGSVQLADDYIESLQIEVSAGGEVYAIGEQQYELELGDSELGIIVVFPERLSSPVMPGDQSISAYRVDVVDSEWQMVGRDGGLTSLVPYFFRWYAPWDVVESELG